MAFRTSIKVRFGDVDHAGIVYYPRFYIYFHEVYVDALGVLLQYCFSR